MSKNKYDGFTLIEVLIVLGVLSFFCLLPTLSVVTWQKQTEVTRFFASFEKSFQETQQATIIWRKSTYVTIEAADQQQQVVFTENTGDGSKTSRILKVPQQLKMYGPNIHFLVGSGDPTTGNSGLAKYTFEYPLKNLRIIYQLEMGSGRFVRKEEKE